MVKPKLSVLIPTYGRESEPKELVAQLLKQSVLPDEIIVLDQNQPTFPSLDQFLSMHPIVRHIKVPEPGVAVNYNRLLRLARFEIVLFLDDDVRLDPHLIENHLRNYQNDESLIGVAGRVEQPSGDLPPGQIHEVGRYHRLSGQVVGNFNSTRTHRVQTAPGGNMSFKKKVLEDVGGFDEGFGGNGYFFETDASLRVTQRGRYLLFEPLASLQHLMSPRGGARIEDKALHTYFYVKNGIRLYRKHSPLGLVPCFVVKMLVYTFLKGVYRRSPKVIFQGIRGVLEGCVQTI